MRVLVVGAGAAGGYIGSGLIAGGRSVTFLVHPHTQPRLAHERLRVRQGGQIGTQQVEAVTAADLAGPYDVVVMAVRSDAVTSAIDDIRDAVGPDTRIVPVMNGMRHLTPLTAAFGRDRVLGGATRLVTSLLPDGTVDVVIPGIDIQIGQLDGAGSDALDRTVAELDVDTVTVRARGDIIAARCGRSSPSSPRPPCSPA